MTGRPTATVTLLTQADCHLCEHAKDVLRRVRQDPTLQVQLVVNETDLGSLDGRRLAADAGVVFAPGILLDGAPFAHGRLSERKLRRALTRRALLR